MSVQLTRRFLGRTTRLGRITGLVGVFLLATTLPVSAQDEAAGAVREVVMRVFDGMHEADSAKVRSAFAEGARFALLSDRDSTSAIRYEPIDSWLAALARSGGRWDERVHDVDIRVDDTIASVWTPYTFLLDGQVRHCGVNSIELLRTPAGWKITQLSDTRRRDGCATPPERSSS